jgi:SAM-dependent methyltransferase
MKKTKKPFINWEVLAQLVMDSQQDQQRKKGIGTGYGAWDDHAAFYDQMAKMEARFTLNQINCFDTDPYDSVLDVGCGPGRITVPMASRAKRVTALDSSSKMLEYCMKNVKEAGLTNVTPKLLDWHEVEPGKNLEQHDIVICSRSPGMKDIMKLSKLARKYVVLINWSNNAPCIPMIVGFLFDGTEEEDDEKQRVKYSCRDRRLGNNLLYNRIYDLGFNPNLKIVEDGFTKDFNSREEAYEDLRRLRPNMPANKMPIFKKNVDKFLAENPDGSFTYLAKTKTVVVWWKPEIEE